MLVKLVKVSRGSIFIADDPTQSIYRYYSWKEKGVHVVGRTKWLRIPYRNTKEIFTAAFSIIKDNPQICEQLQSEGELLHPDIDNRWMRTGPKPLITYVDSLDDETQKISGRVNGLLQNGIPASQIAILAPNNKLKRIFRCAIMDNNVSVNTFYQFNKDKTAARCYHTKTRFFLMLIG